jgi:hypothetical protein
MSSSPFLVSHTFGQAILYKPKHARGLVQQSS